MNLHRTVLLRLIARRAGELADIEMAILRLLYAMSSRPMAEVPTRGEMIKEILCQEFGE